MAVEKARGCGYRKVGGVYLVSDSGVHISCDRLPFELGECPTCGAGVKFSRGFQWIDWWKYAGKHISDEFKGPSDCKCSLMCPICHPEMHRPLIATSPNFEQWKSYGLMWVGESNYTPDEFAKEAVQMGVSKRIPAVPRGIKIGNTWVLCAHISACGTRQEKQEDGSIKTVGVHGVFYVFKPTRIEQLIWERDATDEKLLELKKKGVTPVVIPDGDEDHDPKTPAIPNESVRAEAKNRTYFEDLRSKLKKQD